MKINTNHLVADDGSDDDKIDYEECELNLSEDDVADDYYENIANSVAIRPIAVTEDVDFSIMSTPKKILWWFLTILKLLSCIILSVRTDRVGDKEYLSQHWLHYSCMLVFALISWCPQVFDTLGSFGLVTPGIFQLDNTTAYAICIVGNLYYFTSITIFFEIIGPILRTRIGTAKTLKFWEFYVSLGWQGQTLAFWVLTITPNILTDELSTVPTWFTTFLGLMLMVMGIGSKMGAIYGTGYNTYYWYDMVTHIPNAYFVKIGIYEFVGSPTYTLGRATSFGAAIHYRSVPMLLAACLDLTGISLFDKFVEQPFVKKMYLCKSIKEGNENKSPV